MAQLPAQSILTNGFKCGNTLMNRRSKDQQEIKIANVVATVTLDTPLDLLQLHEKIPQTELPTKSSWLKFRLKPDNTYIAFYKSGKFLITTKNIDRIEEIAQHVLSILHEAGVDTKIVRSDIHNVVVQTKIHLTHPIESIIVNLDPKKASFEPEQFPALIFKDWNVSFLLFSSGSCIITGLKDANEAKTLIQQFSKLIN
jgi:transcription initiation factor TFIID TATA-box-binding protein